MELTKPTLVIMAAGMGNRYGSLKQLDTFNKEGDTLIDFSVYDALRAGFGKIVFIIRKSFEKDFEQRFDNKLFGKIKVNYVYQELNTVPTEFYNQERVKPWGTGHALLMAKDVVKENFAIINSDDFYGFESFKIMAEALQKNDLNSFDAILIAYPLKNTISEHGYVSRGQCELDSKGFLRSIIERTHILKDGGVLNYKNEDGSLTQIDGDTLVSMNFWGFTPKLFEFAETLFLNFMKLHQLNLNAEFYIPFIVNEIIKTNLGKIDVLKTNSKWFGVTYKKDKEVVELEISKLKNKNVYPVNLWS
ncbi:nucleotidyltransferase family protein [Seonamhaeicola maritimus]|uniref:Nucleotide-diphospho-sugar transferase n=1 Tax=Seonamhaeicola maritimus TaxID=2591822 RepID=A0A5C7GG06_9FLAO|nr:sugar phosphate nucleotidyltransferase [Seonamhaeicola maritimus]TXG36083.1 nucleotide-diphospho-sugar transferase [Seonamhaeicola maritimus]